MKLLNPFWMIATLLISFACSSAFATEPVLETQPTPTQPIITPSPPAVDPTVGRFSGFLIGGLTFGPKTDQTIKTTTGTTLGTGKTNDKAGASIGMEALYQPIHYFAASFQINWSPYNYTSGGKGDTQMSYMVIPKIREDLNGFIPWAGLGLGLMTTSIGEPSTTISGVRISADSPTASDFVISPRIGSDFRFGNRFLVGIEAGYTTFTSDITVSVVSGSTTVKVVDTIGRSWFHSGLKVGMVF